MTYLIDTSVLETALTRSDGVLHESHGGENWTGSDCDQRTFWCSDEPYCIEKGRLEARGDKSIEITST